MFVAELSIVQTLQKRGYSDSRITFRHVFLALSELYLFALIHTIAEEVIKSSGNGDLSFASGPSEKVLVSLVIGGVFSCLVIGLDSPARRTFIGQRRRRDQ